MHPKKQRTLVLMKPDSVQRSLIGEIFGRIERTGLKCVGLKMIVATEDQCWKHYNKDDAWFLKKGQGVIENLKAQNMPVYKFLWQIFTEKNVRI